MNIHRKPLKELFQDEFIYEYSINREILHDELLRANTVLFILDRVSKIPLETFFPFGSVFLSHVTDSLFDTCTMCMWRAAIDNSNSEGLTLRKLKNQIIINFKEIEFKEAFIDELKFLKFDEKVRNIEEQIKYIRHNFIAHLNKKEYPIFSYKNILWDVQSVSALLEYQSELNQFFDVLQFEEKYSPHYYGYSYINNENRDNHHTDVDEILDSIIRCSRILNAQDDEPTYWEYLQQKLLNKEQIAIVLEYRKKYRLGSL